MSTYDAIIVDEGQDFELDWIPLLEQVLNSNGEFLLAADSTQNVYGVSQDMSMKGLGSKFSGNWVRLKESYRLPPPLIPFVQDFGNKYLERTTADLPTIQRQHLLPAELMHTKLRWIQVDKENILSAVMHEFDYIIKEYVDKSSASDITILVDNRCMGIKIVELLNTHNIKCLDTFDDNKIFERKKKMFFFKGDARVKVTTVHCFKGWESKSIILCITENLSYKSNAVTYTGLTRIKWSDSGCILSVICSTEGLREYGKKWPNFLCNENIRDYYFTNSSLSNFQ